MNNKGIESTEFISLNVLLLVALYLVVNLLWNFSDKQFSIEIQESAKMFQQREFHCKKCQWGSLFVTPVSLSKKTTFKNDCVHLSDIII